MKWLMDRWKEGLFILTLWAILFGWTLDQLANAGESLEKISKVALSLENPKNDLVDFLVNKGISKRQAKIFAQYNIGPTDTLKVELEPGSLFLEREDVYQTGILKKIVEPGVYKVLDTLWNFKK